MKSKVMTLNLDEESIRMVRELAGKAGLSVSAYLRSKIRELYDESRQKVD
jgi:hypothetical protein